MRSVVGIGGLHGRQIVRDWHGCSAVRGSARGSVDRDQLSTPPLILGTRFNPSHPGPNLRESTRSRSYPGCGCDRDHRDDRLGLSVTRRSRRATSGSVAPLPTVEVLREDYGRTLDVFKMLVDIRFRLLALVPAVSGVAVGLLGKADPQGAGVAVAVLGLIATAGIIVYEIRNSQLHDAAVHRLKFLEALLAGVGQRGSWHTAPRAAVGFRVGRVVDRCAAR